MSGHDARQIGDASRAPVGTCVMSERLFDDGIGWVVLARTLPSGQVGASFFLVDAWCLGVKDAFVFPGHVTADVRGTDGRVAPRTSAR